MIAQPITETVTRFRKASRDRDVPRMYGILEGLASCLVVHGEINEWAVATLVECAKIGDHHRNNREEAMSGAR